MTAQRIVAPCECSHSRYQHHRDASKNCRVPWCDCQTYNPVAPDGGMTTSGALVNAAHLTAKAAHDGDSKRLGRPASAPVPGATS